MKALLDQQFAATLRAEPIRASNPAQVEQKPEPDRTSQVRTIPLPDNSVQICRAQVRQTASPDIS